MKTVWLTLGFLGLLLPIAVQAQVLQKKVSFHYENEPLGAVLEDIAENHGLRFSYSKNFVSLSQRVSLNVTAVPLQEALDELFEQAAIAYAYMGGQMVLKVDKAREQEMLSQIRVPLPEKVKPYRPLIDPQQKERNTQLAMNLPTIDRKVTKKVPGGKRVVTFSPELMNLRPIEEIDPEFEETRLAQVSLLPFLGTNLQNSRKVVNNVSLNIFWGANGGVDGMEVGGLVNSIKKDVRGVQIAGLGNTVGGNTKGTQVSGLFNANEGKVQGVQVGGIFNLSGPAEAVQTAGLFNVCRGDFTGVQASGLFNTSEGEAKGAQVSGLFNVAKDEVDTQVSGLFNVAGDVQYGQVSALLNRGKDVKGFQVGLINIADTIAGTPIGLINIIKRGYNRVEFSASESMYGNFAVKLGAHSFYNIFHFGTRWDDVTFEGTDGEEKTGTFVSWSLGYGLGTAVQLSPSWLMNLEAVSMHVNETEFWTDELNWLNQFRMTFAVKTGRRTSFFAGPVGNLMISKRMDREGNQVGSNIMPYAIVDEYRNDQQIKAWVGFNAGIRF